MNKGLGLMVLVSASLILGAGGGCVPLDQYKQLEMSNRTAVAEKEQCESELFDARAVADSLRTKLTAAEGELASKNQLIANLQSENDHLEEAFNKAQQTLEKLAGKNIPEPVVIEKEAVKLPPALDSALKTFAGQYPNEVEYNAATGAVKWKSDVLFALGSDVVKETALPSLDKFVEILRSSAAADFEVIVVGHTDDKPIVREATRQAHPTNWHLSAHRAISVSNLILKNGYEPTRIGVMGYGEFRPLVSNDSEEDRSRNRRVEIYLVKRGSVLASVEEENVFFAPDLGLAFAKVVR